MKTSKFQELVKPVLVLFLITAIVAALLGFVNAKTEPVIAENTRIAAEQNRKEVLPGSTSFTELSFSEEELKEMNITGAFREDSGLGYVLTSENKGYGGDVAVTVGLSTEGELIGVKANVSKETQGVGSRAGERKYLDRFMGLKESADSIDTLSNATYSSRAVKAGVDAALKAFAKVKEAK